MAASGSDCDGWRGRGQVTYGHRSVVAQKMVTALAQELTRRLNLEKDDPDSMKFATEYAKSITNRYSIPTSGFLPHQTAEHDY